jgi:hypothetical protein
MGINYSQLHNLTARELISALARDGFVSSAGGEFRDQDAEDYDRAPGVLDGRGSETAEADEVAKVSRRGFHAEHAEGFRAENAEGAVGKD